ncbi:SCO family protein [Lutimaribacter sp. EGI FJ00015]|uniref:SCO family protein n=1 Tax=Lutimaribacter degradans TaxID=2945989 RepID=A0ACC5ZXA5_9RHOB|nr:SCO family protein [Lutimaribacter sp. EGI FJ00013]MCM2562004.1 SCO family protein [Lutimaribacter sp. EGI FJ00013]MCO0612964.1 SCO family protein [Lutimaribacter sp. EGI FJ00015]MCO0635836.1 SCO family protein [Lutimaribacter sp. EGI FJ00014]
MTRLYAIAAVVVAAVFLGGLWLLTSGAPDGGDKYAQCRTAAVAGGTSQIGGPFTLIDETGQTVTDKDVIDQPTLLYFGYAFCPDVCPLDNARNAEAIEILEQRDIMVKPVFISVDPERDSPELLADFTDNLHPRMLGLTGTPEQVKAASQAYRTYYKKQEPEEGDEEYYLIDHSTFSYLAFPDEGFVEFFKRDLSPEQLADRLQCFVEAH